MNYIIEGDLNFLTELNKEINDNEEKKDVCLISGNELEEKHVKYILKILQKKSVYNKSKFTY